MAKRDEYGLTLKWREVADLYRGGPDDVRGNARRCYQQVYPNVSVSTAQTEGAKLLRNPHVVAYLEEMTKKASEKASITQERLMLEMSRLATYNVKMFYDDDGNLIPINELSDDAAAVIAGIKVRRIRSNNKEGEQEEESEIIEYKLPTKSATHDQLNRVFGSYEKDNSQKYDQDLIARILEGRKRADDK